MIYNEYNKDEKVENIINENYNKKAALWGLD